MERSEALQLVRQHVKSKNLVNHMLAAEAVMALLAGRLGQDREQWALAGLLHDIDIEATKATPEQHSLAGAEMLAGMGVEPAVVQAIKVHNGAHGIPRQTLIEQALYAVDPLTGLIVAAALIHPAKKLAAIDEAFVVNRYHEKHFAKGANREAIAACQEFGLTLEEFAQAGVEAMQGIAGEIGL